MPEENYIVVKTQHSRPMPLGVAVNVAKLYRERGFGSEIVTEQEAAERSANQQQDLIAYIERARRAQQENEQKHDTQLEIPACPVCGSVEPDCEPDCPAIPPREQLKGI